MEGKEDKILSSDTRKEILINLKQRNKTLSELSREIGVSKPAILKHLIFLSSSEAVKRIKNGNRFIYYRITEKGKRMTDLIISVIVAAFGTSIVHKISVKEEVGYKVAEKAPETVPLPEEAPAQVPKIAEISTPTPEPVKDLSQEATRLPVEVVVTFILIFVAVFFTIRILKKRKN